MSKRILESFNALLQAGLRAESNETKKPEYKAYVKRLLLKQGYYSYLLLATGRQQTETSATATLEGDHVETPNMYTIYVYYREPSDRADRLVAVKRVKAAVDYGL